MTERSSTLLSMSSLALLFVESIHNLGMPTIILLSTIHPSIHSYGILTAFIDATGFPWKMNKHSFHTFQHKLAHFENSMPAVALAMDMAVFVAMRSRWIPRLRLSTLALYAACLSWTIFIAVVRRCVRRRIFNFMTLYCLLTCTGKWYSNFRGHLLPRNILGTFQWNSLKIISCVLAQPVSCYFSGSWHWTWLQNNRFLTQLS